tara:strand:- start:7383 stop:7556 length:174 start_codon:yes stop_codon:yes gene_type:complete
MKEEKKSISARIPETVVDVMEKTRTTPGHRFYDRKNAYIVSKVLQDWANLETDIREE